MPFHNNDLCGLVYNFQGWSIPIPLVSVHLDAKVVNFTSVVEVSQEFVMLKLIQSYRKEINHLELNTMINHFQLVISLNAICHDSIF